MIEKGWTVWYNRLEVNKNDRPPHGGKDYDMNWKRWMAVLLAAALLLPGLAWAEEEAQLSAFDQRAASWMMIRQNDRRYDNWRYDWNKDRLSVRGCGPVSITNALIAAYDITEQEQVDIVLREALYLLADHHAPALMGMYVNNMAEFVTMEQADYPTLWSYQQGYTEHCTFSDEDMDLAAVRAIADPILDKGESVMVIGYLGARTRWRVIAELCAWLNEIGRGDAMVLLPYVSGGTLSTEAPFCTKDGHYMTICVQAEEYARCGGVYLLDSLPRAIQGEYYKNNTYYSQYNFVQAYRCYGFRCTYDVKRIRQEIIKMELMPELLEELNGLSGEARIARETEHLEKIAMYGAGILMVCLPPVEGAE